MTRGLLIVAVALLAGTAGANAQDRVVTTASDVAVGDLGGPVGPDGTRYPDKVVADPSAPVVHVFVGNATGFEPDQPAFFGGPGLTGNAVALDDLDHDGKTDLIVADRTGGAVWVLNGHGDGRFGEGHTVAVGTDPAVVTIGDFAADRIFDDIAITDARTGMVSIVGGQGDLRRFPDADAHSLAAGGGVVSWSDPTSNGMYQLTIDAKGMIADVPAVTSELPIIPRIGRVRPGLAALAYVTCRAGCLPQRLDLRTRVETELRLRTARGCRIGSVAVWDSVTAYDVVARSRGACAMRARGVWQRIGRRKPTRRGSGRLGDLRDGFVTWVAPSPAGRGEQLRVARVRGPARTVARIRDTTFVEPRINGRRLIYGVDTAGRAPGGIELHRLALGVRRSCFDVFTDTPWMAIPSWTAPAPFAVDGSRIYYADAPPPGSFSRGIFLITTRGRWIATGDCVG